MADDEQKTKDELIEEVRRLRRALDAGQGSAPGEDPAPAAPCLLQGAEAILEAVRQPLLVLDPDLQILTASRSYYNTFGTSPDEVCGRSLYELGDRQWDIPQLKDQLEGLVSKRGPFVDFEVELPTAGDRHRTLVLFALHIEQEGAGRPLILLAMQDVTERREMEERLARAEKLAALGQLAGGVAHELRNPLGAIKNSAYFLRMALAEPQSEIQETLDILDREVTACERIINSLLDFTRTKPPQRREMDANAVLRRAVDRMAVPADVEVAACLADDLPRIQADPDQVDQVVTNLVANALQAMPDGGRLTLSSQVVAPGQVAVRITDTGTGIPPGELGKLFEPLYTTRAQGIGLGLAVTRALVNGHGGTIDVHSEVGKGSTFTVTLPIQPREGDHDAPEGPRPDRGR